MKDCNACGKCCVKYGGQGLTVSKKELGQWEDDAPELLNYTQDGKIWFDIKTKQPLQACPWLKPTEDSKVFHCEIYYDRPNDCRYYPSTLDEMIRDECEMIQPKDLRQPKQAVKDLEFIMKDSWNIE